MMLYCPSCGDAPLREWVRILRGVRDALGRSEPIDVYRHKRCRSLAYLVGGAVAESAMMRTN